MKCLSFMLPLWVIGLSMLVAMGCNAPNGENGNSTHRWAETWIPVTAECKSILENALMGGPLANQTKFEYKSFNHSLASEHYPNLVGALDVWLTREPPDTNPEEYLRSILNGPILRCYPTSSFEVNSNELGPILRSILSHVKSTGAYPYVVVTDDGVVVYSAREKEGPYQNP